MATETKITLKLLVDRNTKKVLYAEAKKDFVDFLFGLLQIPIGSIINLLKQNNISASGSFSRVLNSVQELESAHFHSYSHKQNILTPTVRAASYGNNTTPLLLKNFAAFEDKISSDHCSSHSSPFIASSSCGSSSSSQQVGYVKDSLLTYMVTDDLVVKSMSTISTFSLLQTFGVKDIGSIQERNVTIDFKKGLELVKAALVSDTVLTDVFTSSKGTQVTISPCHT